MSNSITTPITGNIAYSNAGIIKAIGPEMEKISVAKIEYQHFDDERFQYIISPFWDIIDNLPDSIFSGIPGIKMERRLESYYRVNYTPVFITERTPSPNREDLWELMKSVGLDYYDRLEWLIRTSMRSANDNLIVDRMRKEKKLFNLNEPSVKLEDLQYGDDVMVDSIENIGNTTGSFIKNLAGILFAGANLITKLGDSLILESERAVLFPVVLAQYKIWKREVRSKQAKGISSAKNQGKYKGRPKAQVDKDKLETAYKKLKSKEISIEEALLISGVSSRATFYRRVNDL